MGIASVNLGGGSGRIIETNRKDIWVMGRLWKGKEKSMILIDNVLPTNQLGTLYDAKH